MTEKEWLGGQAGCQVLFVHDTPHGLREVRAVVLSGDLWPLLQWLSRYSVPGTFKDDGYQTAIPLRKMRRPK